MDAVLLKAVNNKEAEYYGNIMHDGITCTKAWKRILKSMVEIGEKKPIWRTVWFAVLVCVVLLVLAVVPEVSDWLQQIDQHAAVWLNNLAGRSPVFDRLVLLLADEDGWERITVLSVIWFLVALWRAPTRVDQSRLLGTLLFVVVVLLLYFLMDSLLDDVIERKSPSMEFLQPFRNIKKILDFNVDLTDRRSFPSPDGMIFFTISFLLLRLGHRRGGLVALLLAFTAPLLRCVAGLSWISDIYLGALPVSLLISAVAVETPFVRLFDSSVDVAAAAIDQGERFGRGLFPMWHHRRLYWVSQKAYHMEAAVKRFAARELPRILDREGRYAGGLPVLEVPLGGLRSVVRIVTLGPVKAVLRAYPVTQKFEAEQHFRASQLLRKHGLRVPKVLYHTENPHKYGAIFLVEEFIEGCSKNADDLDERDITEAAKALAQLHRIKSDNWGPVAAPRTEEYGTVLLRRLDRQLGKIARGSVLSGQQNALNDVRLWFSQWREKLNAIREFSLIHGKLHRENALFEENGGYCLLDTTTLEWGMAAADLVIVHASQCDGNAALIEQFNAAYYSELSPDERESVQASMPLYEALFCVAQISKYTKRLRRTKVRHVGDAITKGTKWWHRLLEIVEREPLTEMK